MKNTSGDLNLLFLSRANSFIFYIFAANDLDGAARAAVNYLHLKPHDIIMQGNLEYYRSQEVKVDQIKANPVSIIHLHLLILNTAIARYN